MMIDTKKDVRSILDMPYEVFKKEVHPQAKDVLIRHKDNQITVSAMLAYNNVCKNNCAYCGMRAGNSGVNRYRIALDDVKRAANHAKSLGLTRLFLISGDDPKYAFEDILQMVTYAKSLGLYVSMGIGELEHSLYDELAHAGLDEYVLKFETSNKEYFKKIKPNTTYQKRMGCIEHIRSTSMQLASGNIVDMPGTSLDTLADDIMLMKELEISWAPIIPYMPVPHTPLAQEGGRGRVDLTLREIAILRLMMPTVNITAQQPGDNPKEGLGSVEGNLNALNCGANMLFVDLLPKDKVKDFSVIDNRMIEGMKHVERITQLAGMTKC